MLSKIKQTKRGRLIKWPVYFFIISIIALTGFEFFFRGKALIIPIFILSILYFINNKLKFGEQFFLVAIPFLVLSLIQTILGYNQNILTPVLLFVSFLTYFVIAAISERNFVEAYIKIIFVISLISIVFFFLTYSDVFMSFITTKIAPHFTSLGSDKADEADFFNEHRNILIYNFKNYAFLYNRNCGPFWEPGMFTVFINLALFFNLIVSKRLFSFKNITFIITIITTFSTTGYIALIFILLIYSIFYSRSKLSFLYLTIIVAASVFISNLDFMKSKISDQYSDKTGTSRFGATLIHFKVITEHPFIGVGDGASTFIASFTNADSTPNGITFVFVKYGVILGIFYYVLLYNACVRIMRRYSSNKILGYSLLILLIILTFSQDISVRYFYWFIIVWGTIDLPSSKKTNRQSFQTIQHT